MYLSDLTCSTSYITGTYLAENGEISVTCRVELGGGWKPEVTCKVAGSGLIGNYTYSSISSSVSAVTASFRGRAEKEFDGSSIRCNVQFDTTAIPASSLHVASNIPVSTLQWNSTVLRVTCKYDTILYS